MAAPIRFLSGRNQQQKIGIEGSTENQKVLEVVGRVGVGTTIFEPSKLLDVRGDVIISGELTVGDTTFGTDTNTRNLSVSGVSTFAGAIDANGDLDVDGHTELDNLNVSGVSTFNNNVEFDSEGAHIEFTPSSYSGSAPNIEFWVGNNSGTHYATIDGGNAGQLAIHNTSHPSGVLDFRSKESFSFQVDGYYAVYCPANAGVKLYHPGSQGNILSQKFETLGAGVTVTGTTFSNQLNVSGVSTFAGAIDANGSLDVDGHSELDNVNVSGIITTASLNATGKLITTGIGISIANGAGNIAYIEGPSEIWIDPHPFGVGQTSGSVRIKGDLYVDGTEFIVDVDKIELGDFNIGIASTVTTNSLLDGAGLGIGATSIRKFITWNNATSALMSSENWNLASGKHYEIGGTDVLTSDTLGSGVVNSSLTSVGTLGALTVSGNVNANGNIIGDGATNISGINSVTATLFHGSGANLTSIPNGALANSSVNYGGVTLALGGSDTTPAFDLSDATAYPTSSLVGTITNAQLAGSIANAKLVNDSVSFGGVSLDLGQSDATPAFDLSDATAYPTSSLVGTITNAQLAGSIANAKLVNDSVSFGGVSVDLGASDATPAFDLSDATAYPTSSLVGTITNAQLAGSIADGKLASTFLKNVVEDTTPQLGGNLDLNSKFITGTGGINVTGVVTATTFDGNVTGTAGTASNASGATGDFSIADKIIHTGDTNTAIRFPADDTFTVETAGSERLRITSAGNVGIGSEIPTQKLDVNGTVKATTFSGSGANLTSIPNSALINDSVSYGGVSLDLGQTDATPAFDLSDATAYPTSSLVGTITNAQLAGSIANNKLVNDSVSYGGVSLDLGQSDATPAFDLSDATNYPTSSLSGTITNAQLAGSIANNKLANDSVSYGGVSLDLGASDATPAFDLSDATAYPYTSLTGISTSIVGDTTPQLGGNLDFNSKFITGTGGINVTGVVTATTFDGNVTGNVTGGVSGNAGTATSLSSARNFSISGDVVASAVSFDGTGDVVLSTAIQPNSVALATDTTGDFVQSITGTTNEVTVSATSGENSTPQIGLPDDVTIGQDLTVTRNIDVDGHTELDDVNVSGALTATSLNVTNKLITTGIGISIANGAGNTAYIEGPSEIWIDPHPFGVGQTSGSVRIKGDLYVDGTEFIVNVDKIQLGDFRIGIATTAGTNALLDGAGLGIGSESIEKTITWNNSTSALMSSENWNLASGKHYEINGTDVLTSNTLGSGIINSSLTSVGTLGSLTVSGNVTIADKIIHDGDTNTAIRFPADDTVTVETGGTERLRITSAGNVGIGSEIPSEKLDVNGNVKAIDFNTTSDENLKDNIRTIEDPLAKVVQIRGVNFDWKETQKPSVGVIAQEVEKVLPELVTDSGTKTVNYNGLIGLLIEVVKEQQTQINSLNERLSKLE